jgi:hypothetical protein
MGACGRGEAPGPHPGPPSRRDPDRRPARGTPVTRAPGHRPAGSAASTVPSRFFTGPSTRPGRSRGEVTPRGPPALVAVQVLRSHGSSASRGRGIQPAGSPADRMPCPLVAERLDHLRKHVLPDLELAAAPRRSVSAISIRRSERLVSGISLRNPLLLADQLELDHRLPSGGVETCPACLPVRA